MRTTIVGVATGSPDGGVAIVRLSGPQAFALGQRATGQELPAVRRLEARRIACNAGKTWERCLVVCMQGPASFTGEDVVELHVHAGVANVRELVHGLVELGAVPAMAGEFTRRAFEHGKLSLDEAEGVAAVIGAQTQAALEHARRLVDGELGRDVDRLREALEQVRLEVEANLDFPDDVEPGSHARWADELLPIERTLAGWVERFERSRKWREGERVVLAGPANAGKSSLFNALIGRARALVSEVPGTTRDYLEARLTLGGRDITLVDTAGLREADDSLERQGVSLAHAQLSEADLIIWLEASNAESVARPAVADVAVLCVESKRDLGAQRHGWLGVSVGDSAAIDVLSSQIVGVLAERAFEPWVGLSRHRDCAAEALEALRGARASLRSAAPLELGSFELAVAERRLAEIRGRAHLGPVGEDVLDGVFARFCIGK